MAAAEFFLHHRADGAERAGFAVDDALTRHRFDDRWDDPTLIWFVELTARGSSVPADPDAARDWFAANAPAFRPLLAEAVDLLDDGAAGESWPIRLDGEAADAAVELRLYVAHGFGPRALASEVTKLARDLGETVRALPPHDEAAYRAKRDAWYAGLAA